MKRKIQVVIPMAAVAAAIALVFLLSQAAGRAGAEGERYDRLEIPAPEAKPLQGQAELSPSTIQVIVSAFTRVNKSLDLSTASSYAVYILEASERFGVHPFMVASIIIRESTVKQNARSRYAYGLMQVNWKAHRKGLKAAFNCIQTLNDLLQPRNNILAGTWIFSWYLKSSGGNIDRALTMYLGRSGRKYIKRVLAGYHQMIKECEKIEKRADVIMAGSTTSVAFAVK